MPEPLPTEYVTADEAREYLNTVLGEFPDVTDAMLALQIKTAGELINAHCGRGFTEEVPSIVKTTALRVLTVLCTDLTKDSESVDDYSYSRNKKALDAALALLDEIPDEEGILPSAHRRHITVKVV